MNNEELIPMLRNVISDQCNWGRLASLFTYTGLFARQVRLSVRPLLTLQVCVAVTLVY